MVLIIPALRRAAWGLVGLYAVSMLWNAAEQFEDCYQRSYTGISRITVNGPHEIYDRINAGVGHYTANGLLLFTHDYSPYRRMTGFKRIGDMISVGCFASYNALVYAPQFLKTNIDEEYRFKTQAEFETRIGADPRNRHIIIQSLDEAVQYIQEHRIDLREKDAVYMTPDYQIVNLREHMIPLAGGDVK